MHYDHLRFDDPYNFLLKGFCVFENTNLISQFYEIENYKIEDCNVLECDDLEKHMPKKVVDVLKDVQKKIGDTYISKLYDNWKPMSVGMWDGIDEGSEKWHNDSNEGMSFNFLLYFDDMFPTTGGALHVKGPQSEEIIYPKRDMLVWINQSEQFFHKADKSHAQRRLASFEYKL